jgi:hypothetical protein
MIAASTMDSIMKSLISTKKRNNYITGGLVLVFSLASCIPRHIAIVACYGNLDLYPNFAGDILSVCVYVYAFLSIVFLQKQYFSIIEELKVSTDEKINIIKKPPYKIFILMYLAYNIASVFSNISDFTNPKFMNLKVCMGDIFAWCTQGFFITTIVLSTWLILQFASCLYLPKKISGKIVLDPFHADAMFGVRYIGRFCLAASIWYYGFAGLELVFYYTVSGLSQIQNVVVLIIGAFGLGIILFLHPQMLIHQLIIKKKTEMIQHLIDRIDFKHEAKDHEEITRKLYYMNQLDHVKALRDYPFDIGVIKKFLLAACTPLISLVVGFLLSAV